VCGPAHFSTQIRRQKILFLKLDLFVFAPPRSLRGVTQFPSKLSVGGNGFLSYEQYGAPDLYISLQLQLAPMSKFAARERSFLRAREIFL